MGGRKLIPLGSLLLAAAVAGPAAPMTPTDFALSLRRMTDELAITHSRFDEDDVTEHHPVSDHPVTSSAFDQQDRVSTAARRRC